MSLIFMVFYWVAIPVIVLLAARWALRRVKTSSLKVMVVIVAAAGFLGWFWLVAGEKLWLDHKVRELCAVDGGVRVYETVMLPREKFNQWRQPNFYSPTQGEDALGPEYVFKEESPDFENKDAKAFRYHYKVIRRSDQKVLGETTSYERRGGDLPGPWQPSSFTCPAIKEAGPNALLMKVFVPSN